MQPMIFLKDIFQRPIRLVHREKYLDLPKCMSIGNDADLRSSPEGESSKLGAGFAEF